MSESPKPRFAVDLNEIEQQLAQASPPQPKSATATRNDPLAELARIVGQDDPFQAILANDGAPRPRRQPSAVDDLFVDRDNVTQQARQSPPQARQPSFERPDVRLGGYVQPEAPRAQAQAYDYQQPAPAYRQDAPEEGYYDEADSYGRDDYAQPERLDYPSIGRQRHRKGLVAMGAIVVAIVIGGAGAYLFTGSSGPAGGEPILIQATKDPVKVQPQNPGGVEIPNQNKQIYERTQNTDTKVVNREEQPVDVKQAVYSNGGSAVADATGATAPSAASHGRTGSSSLNLGEPRKVRTVTIRPDGTVVGAPEATTHAQPAQAPVPTMTMPAAAQPAAAQTAAAQPKPVAATPVAAPATPAPAPKPAPVAATPVEATPAAASQKVASAQPVAVAPAADTTTTSVGGYAVQLGLANSEGAAEAAFASYQRKYPDLEGRASIIRKAEVNGNTIYRVRVGPMSREEASSLCSKLQGQGGQCFVAKN